jgi:hypothetical protein
MFSTYPHVPTFSHSTLRGYPSISLVISPTFRMCPHAYYYLLLIFRMCPHAHQSCSLMFCVYPHTLAHSRFSLRMRPHVLRQFSVTFRMRRVTPAFYILKLCYFLSHIFRNLRASDNHILFPYMHLCIFRHTVWAFYRPFLTSFSYLQVSWNPLTSYISPLTSHVRLHTLRICAILCCTCLCIFQIAVLLLRARSHLSQIAALLFRVRSRLSQNAAIMLRASSHISYHPVTTFYYYILPFHLCP